MTRDTNRIVWLFGKPYWWQIHPPGQLTLHPASWIAETAERPIVNVAYWGDASEFARKVAQAVRDASVAGGAA